MTRIGNYLDLLIKNLPYSIFEELFSVFCIGSLLLLILKRRKAGRYVAGLLLMEYSFLLYCSTVIFRKVLSESKFNLIPFWSYRAYLDGKEFYLAENIMNVAVFVPVGLLFGITMCGRNAWAALLVGAGLSVGIEGLQFVFKKGFTEVDDVMHNTLGCMIGYGVYSLVRIRHEKFYNL